MSDASTAVRSVWRRIPVEYVVAGVLSIIAIVVFRLNNSEVSLSLFALPIVAIALHAYYSGQAERKRESGSSAVVIDPRRQRVRHLMTAIVIFSVTVGLSVLSGMLLSVAYDRWTSDNWPWLWGGVAVLSITLPAAIVIKLLGPRAGND